MSESFSGQITFIYTSDLERAAGFYSGVVGLEQVLDQDRCRIFKVSAGAFLGVCDLRDRPRGRTGLTISFITDDVDGWHARLSQAGMECIYPPEHSERFGIYGTLFLDPDGYRIEFQEFRDPRWK